MDDLKRILKGAKPRVDNWTERVVMKIIDAVVNLFMRLGLDPYGNLALGVAVFLTMCYGAILGIAAFGALVTLVRCFEVLKSLVYVAL